MSATTKTDHALERLVFFSDAVFAIAITLLVIDLHAPVLPKGSADSAYWAALADEIPGLVGYFLSFMVVGVFWIGHHRAFALAARYSSRVLPWNLALLSVIAFMPFVTAFWTHNLNQRVPTMFYCGALLCAGILNAAVVHTATGAAMADPAADPAQILYARRRSLSVVLGGATALALSFWLPQFGQLGLASIGAWRRLIARRPAA